MKNKLDTLVESFFSPKRRPLDFGLLLEMVEQIIDEESPEKEFLKEAAQERFSATIPIPRLTPSEAWGDPSSQSRKEVDKVFSSVMGGNTIKARLDRLSAFLDPTRAKKKRSPRVIINMMMIMEALQATLNDFNESASGFVFEGFMASLTGGKQIAGRVKGTLPIEDFMAFSEFGSNTPVSLKLLKSEGVVKGSFTNLVDFLLVRGTPSIKYLITYKTTTSGGVEGLLFFDFDITTENFVDFIVGTRGDSLIAATDGSFKQDDVRSAFANYVSSPSEGLPALANMVVKMGGYQKAGLLHRFVETGEFEEFSPEKEAEKEAERTSKALYSQEKVRRDLERRTQQMNEMLQSGEITHNQAFHQMEKLSVQEENILNEGKGGDEKSQWSASWAQMKGLPNINFQVYGELDLSQNNISELVEIYSDILGDELKSLLENVKELTENVGVYYAAKKRTKGQAAGKRAESNAEEIKNNLEADPLGRAEDEQ